MPFDGTDALPALRRAQLSEALRGTLPAGIKFNYMTVYHKERCGTTVCALGLAALLWPEHKKMLIDSGQREKHAEFFGLTRRASDAIFWGKGAINGYGRPFRGEATASEVARALDCARP